MITALSISSSSFVLLLSNTSNQWLLNLFSVLGQSVHVKYSSLSLLVIFTSQILFCVLIRLIFLFSPCYLPGITFSNLYFHSSYTIDILNIFTGWILLKKFIPSDNALISQNNLLILFDLFSQLYIFKKMLFFFLFFSLIFPIWKTDYANLFFL